MLSWPPLAVLSSCDLNWKEEADMARWPRTAWTTLFTYGAIFILFPLLCWLAYLWVQGRLF